jgi:hypothetical protein
MAFDSGIGTNYDNAWKRLVGIILPLIRIEKSGLNLIF